VDVHQELYRSFSRDTSNRLQVGQYLLAVILQTGLATTKSIRQT
jgi:hypothetical protein